jgi:hypothetical protein
LIWCHAVKARVWPPAVIKVEVSADRSAGPQTTLAYTENGIALGNSLGMTDGRHAATMALLGDYMAENFATTAGGQGGTLISGTPSWPRLARVGRSGFSRWPLTERRLFQRYRADRRAVS